MKKIIIALIIIVVLALGWILFLKSRLIEDILPACTEEAKLCPDGSAVGRVGPNCEFAKCPDVGSSTSNIIDTSDWKTYSRTYQNVSFEIKYPDGYTISEPDGLYTSIVFHKDGRTFEIRITENCSSASGANTSIVKLDGINFTKYYESRSYSAQVSTSAYKYCAVVNGWAYNLIPSVVSHDSFAADSDQILNQILSTFKFTK